MSTTSVVASLNNVTRTFVSKRGDVKALDEVSISLQQGKTLALVGESGSGKTTVARILLGLDQPDSGSVNILGSELGGLKHEQMRLLRKSIQVVQQDPYSQLNRRHCVERIIEGPLLAFSVGDKISRRDKVISLLKAVGLEEEHLRRRPHELSGGQCQRVAIARALALDPKIVVLDEAVSALDVSVRAQVLNLLRELRDELGLTYLFITHDLGVAHYLADEIAVMFRGRIVEQGDRKDVFIDSKHPYTVDLLKSVPLAVPRDEKRQNNMEVQTLPSPNPGDACTYRSRCTVGHDLAQCASTKLAFTEGSATHLWMCHFPVGGK
jgi:oligopeptide/dipeptide ABC transporter ATP-binding protein